MKTSTAATAPTQVDVLNAVLALRVRGSEKVVNDSSLRLAMRYAIQAGFVAVTDGWDLSVTPAGQAALDAE